MPDRRPPWRGRNVRPAPLALAALAALAAATAVVVVSLAQPPAESEYPHGEFQGDCSLCHSADAWLPAKPGKEFDHAKLGMRLEGAHAVAKCRACHVSLDFTKQKKQACVACHQDVHRGELGTDCERCHTARSFIDRGGMVRAHQLTRFPLQGVHASLDCERCHPPAPAGRMQFVGTQPECYACHSDAYLAADPDHQGSGFSQDCSMCHSPLFWQPARFSHEGTDFPLTGAHKPLPCGSCHGDGVYDGKSADCYSCHRDDYDATADPVHTTVGFPTACADCHTTSAWRPSTFDHDGRYFPIYSGKHAGKWTSCSTCHDVPTNYAQFTCFGCHPHSDQAGTDERHREVGGYRYDSQACYSCHPDGTGGN